MRDLVKKNQFIALILGALALSLIDEVVLSRFFEMDELSNSETLFKGFSQFLFILSLAFGALLYFGYKRSKKQAQDLKNERDKTRLLASRLASHKLGIDAHAIVSIVDPKGNIVYANDRFCEVSGFSQEELIGQNHRILNSGYHDHAFFEEMYETIKRGDTWAGEICNRAKDGSIYWIATTIVPIFDATGRIEEIISIRTNITAIKANEAALKASSDLLNSTFDNFPGGISVFDSDKRLILANKALYDLLEISPEDFPLGCNYADILRRNIELGVYGEVDTESFIDDRLDRLAEQKPFQINRSTPNGRVVEIKSWPLEDGGAVAAHYDVTERHRMLEDLKSKNKEAEATARKLLSAQQEQEKANKRLINSINSMQGGFALWDRKTRLVIANEAFKQYHKELVHLIKPGLMLRDFLRSGQEINFWDWKQDLPDNWLDVFVERFKATEKFEASFETNGREASGSLLHRSCEW